MDTWRRVSGLEIEIEGYEISGHASDWRLTSIVRLCGGGHEGLGEDPNYEPGEQLAFQEVGPTLPLGGQRTLGELSDLLETLPIFPATPVYPGSEDCRRWGFDPRPRGFTWAENPSTKLEPDMPTPTEVPPGRPRPRRQRYRQLLITGTALATAACGRCTFAAASTPSPSSRGPIGCFCCLATVAPTTPHWPA